MLNILVLGHKFISAFISFEMFEKVQDIDFSKEHRVIA